MGYPKKERQLNIRYDPEFVAQVDRLLPGEPEYDRSKFVRRLLAWALTQYEAAGSFHVLERSSTSPAAEAARKGAAWYERKHRKRHRTEEAG